MKEEWGKKMKKDQKDQTKNDDIIEQEEDWEDWIKEWEGGYFGYPSYHTWMRLKVLKKK